MSDVALTESYYPIRDAETVLESTVGQLLREAADAVPDDLALVELVQDGSHGRRYSFGDLLDQAERLAHALASRFAPGERVCVWAPNVPEWVILEFACGLAGLTLVTANPAYQARELRYVLEQSGSVGLFLVKSYRGNPMAEIADQAVETLTDLREVIDIEDADALFAPGEREASLPVVKAGDPAQIQYTSGTTGFPKGAVLSHRGLTNNARFYGQRLQAKPGVPWANVMPLFHTSGCGMAVLGAVQMRAPLYMFQIFDPVAFLRVIEQDRIAVTGGVPTMLSAMLEVLDQQEFDLSSLLGIMCGGSMVSPSLAQAARDRMGCDVMTVYGQTETSPLVTMLRPGESFDDICNTIGQPMPQTEVAVRDPNSGLIVPLGTRGEICVRGYTCMIEYNDNPKATAATVDGEGWLRTGDLGVMDARGYVAVSGRVKEMIIRGGENLFPVEIENALLEHPDVAEVAVVGLPDERWGEIVAAFVRFHDSIDPDAAALKVHCRRLLAPIKTPVVWCAVDGFPLTGSGKIRKFELRDGYLAGQYREIHTEPSGSAAG